MTKRHYPAADRNRDPIADVLAPALPSAGVVLEIASGTGQHTAYFAARFAALTWQPTELDPGLLESIAAYTEGLPNVRPPMRLDTRETWRMEAQAIVCINMVHISPWASTLGLLDNAARLLGPGELLFLYGPYTIDGAFNAESNVRFHESLQARNPEWGLRDLRDLEQAAAGRFTLERRVDMPANNYSLLFRRSGSSGQSGST